jgi:hypothetical protein
MKADAGMKANAEMKADAENELMPKASFAVT